MLLIIVLYHWFWSGKIEGELWDSARDFRLRRRKQDLGSVYEEVIYFSRGVRRSWFLLGSVLDFLGYLGLVAFFLESFRYYFYLNCLLLSPLWEAGPRKARTRRPVSWESTAEWPAGLHSCSFHQPPGIWETSGKPAIFFFLAPSLTYSLQ